MTRLAPVSLTLDVSFVLRRGTRSLLLDHLQEFLFFILSQLLVLLHTLNIKLVLCLGPRWLEWTSKDSNLGISNDVGHLRMREILVDNNTLDEGCIFERTSDFTIDLDELEIDVFTGQVGDGEDGIYGNIGEFIVGDRHTVVSFERMMRAYILDPREVLAVLKRFEVSSGLNSIYTISIEILSTLVDLQCRRLGPTPE